MPVLAPLGTAAVPTVLSSSVTSTSIGGVAAAIEDLAAVDVNNHAHDETRPFLIKNKSKC